MAASHSLSTTKRGKAMALKKYKIVTYDWGTFYRWARNPAAARARVAYAIFGPGYEGGEDDHWDVEEVA